MAKNENDAPVHAVPYGTLSVEGVKQWRDTVEEFFCNDWQQLQDFILEIEASVWEKSPEEIDQESDDSAPDSHQNSSVQTESTNTENQRKLNVPKSADPVQKQRLDDLARKIEARLKNERA